MYDILYLYHNCIFCSVAYPCLWDSQIRILWSEVPVRIRIFPSSSKYSLKKTLNPSVLWLLYDFFLKNLESFCFVTSLWLLIFGKWLMYFQKVKRKKNLLPSWLSLTKIAGSWAGSVSQRYGSAVPDPYQNVRDPQHRFFVLCLISFRAPLTFCGKQLMRLNVQVSDKNYAVAGDILDGYLYDLFMNMLGQ